ncbi:ribose operon repressor [Lactobacillus selangorensis]|uniref:Ribose operon repressor n=1 Tax=Lactobacillus selangorensis TaxID=81857 RepID=A0A0R2G0U1_9LACO|nr:LacI family DNA-binding transcriptional regulator [Lactobacillus selangorensis]KRN28576.1 ribose operon repressor [Lactobacillus selangorensis]KRN33014.1 ribose operon repressor [Lactobacillus selangorensis]
MKLKMSDIADMAHVSKSAVSLALNGKPGISEDTRQKILGIIAEQGYTPLRKSHKDIETGIGEVTFLVVTTSGVVQNNYQSLPFFNDLISALSTNVNHLQGSLRTVTIQADDLNEKIDAVARTSHHGVLVLGTDLTKKQVMLINEQLHNVVFLDTYFKEINADFVTMDNYQGAQLAARYILSKGYRDIGYFASDKLISNFNGRRRGFHDALSDAGVHITNDHFYYISPTELEPQGLKLSSYGKNLPKAIFCEDDYIALRLIKAAQKEKITVPDDVAVMGFDDIYGATLISPELSTIHVPAEQMARQALHQLQGQLESSNWNAQKTLVATTLVQRQSL